MYYVEIVEGGSNRRGQFAQVGSQINIDYFGVSQQKRDCFTSAYMFDESILKYAKEHSNSVRGNKCPVASEMLWWDIDRKDSTRSDDELLADGIRDVNTLAVYLVTSLGVPAERIKIFYSGKKGFHLYMMSPEVASLGCVEGLPNVVRASCLLIASQCGVTVDTTVYDRSRLFRIPNSLHSSGRYKVDVTDISSDALAIMERSSRQHQHHWKLTNSGYISSIGTVLASACEITHASPRALSSVAGGKLLEVISNGPKDGEKATTITSLAGLLHSKNLSPDLIEGIISTMAKQWNVSNKYQKEISEFDVSSIVGSVTQYERTVNMISDGTVHTVSDSLESWYDGITTNGYTVFGNRLPHLSEKLATASPGDVVIVVGASGTGKSTFGLVVGREIAEAMGTFSYFASVEMSRHSLSFRAATIDIVSEANPMGAKEVASELINNADRRKKIGAMWTRVLIDDESSNIKMIEERFVQTKERLQREGKQIGDLFIDYGQLLDGTETNDKEKAVARSLKGMAKRLGVRVWMFLQMKKSNGRGAEYDSYTEPSRSAIEGSGGWYQTSDYALYIWKSKAFDGRLHAKLDKDRWNPGDGKFDLLTDGINFTTVNVEDEPAEKVELSVSDNMKQAMAFKVATK